MWCMVGVVSAGKNGLRSTRNLLGEKSTFSCFIWLVFHWTIWKMLPNRNFCTYCGWPVEDNYPVGALCLALFLFPIGIIPCCLLKVSHSQPVPTLSCLALSCLVLPCIALSCLVLPCFALSCLVLKSNNRPTMQERQCVKCNRSSVWWGDHDSRLKKTDE